MPSKIAIAALPKGAEYGDLSDWEQVFRVLDDLTPEQRCDALYADWLCQLSSATGQTLVGIKDDLIGERALDAKYLAELAQNADDAAEGNGTFSVSLHKDWLIVQNNGRRFGARDLHGLCRFFAGGKRFKKDAIGRFGIGFKACYWIADEVLVQTWDEDESFAFRLPISRAERSASHPDKQRLDKIIGLLRENGEAVDDAVNDLEVLGYCTPEYLDALPGELHNAKLPVGDGRSGSVFLFHLNQDGVADVNARLGDSRKVLYDLFPVFLRRVTTILVGDFTATVHKGRVASTDAGAVQRCHLEIGERGKNSTHEYFWLIRDHNDPDLWTLALRCNEQSQIRAESAFGRSSLFRCGAYAFFPLENHSGVGWPLNLHIHLNLPTNLARSDWSDNEAGKRDGQVVQAASTVCRWLESSREHWHSDWSIDQIFVRQPEQTTPVPRLFFDTVKSEAKKRALLTDLWGNPLRSTDAKAVTLHEGQRIKDSWRALGRKLDDPTRRLPLVLTNGGAALVDEEVKSTELRQWLTKCTDFTEDDQEFARDLFVATLGVKRFAPAFAETVLRSLKVKRANGAFTTVADLMTQPGGASLDQKWHTCFGMVMSALPQQCLYTSFFNGTLGGHLRKLAESTFFVDWDEVADVLQTEDAWRHNGEAFWDQPRTECPVSLRKGVARLLRIHEYPDKWVPISSKWLLDGTPVNCFADVVSRHIGTDQAGVTASSLREGYVRKLQRWGLYRTYEEAVQEKLKSELPTTLLSTMVGKDGSGPALLLSRSHTSSKGYLGAGWSHILREAEDAALARYLTDHGCVKRNTSYLIVGHGLGLSHCEVLQFMPGYEGAPSWLTKDVQQLLDTRGLFGGLGIHVLTGQSLTANRKAALGKELLENYWRWKDKDLSGRQKEAVSDLCQQVSPTTDLVYAPGHRKRLNEFVLSAPDDSLFGVLMSGSPLKFHQHSLLDGVAAAIPAIRDKCLPADEFVCSIDCAVDPVPVSVSDVPASMAETPIFDRYTRQCPEAQIWYAPGFSIVWKHNGTEMCRRGQMRCAYDGNAIYVAERISERDDPENEEYGRLLDVYITDFGDREVRTTKRSAVDLKSVYNTYRQRILEAFRSAIFNDGYKHEHVIRELLQNSESAYASRPDMDSRRKAKRFMVSVRIAPSLDKVQVTVRHFGRGFNEIDDQGESRPDIERIVCRDQKAFAVSHREEIGRFNRGFKSVFTLTDEVRIRSNGYEFAVADLFRLDPTEPVQREQPESGKTEFAFKCSVADARAMLQLRRGAKKGSLRQDVLTPNLLMFLQHIDDVALDVKLASEACTQRWFLKRVPEKIPGWRRLTIEDEDGTCTEFLIYHGRVPGIDSLNRVSVGIRLSRGVPEVMTNCRLCLTFPTNTAFSCGFLASGDFEAESSRRSILIAGNHRNAAILRAAVERTAEYCGKRLKEASDLADWLAWAKVWNLRALSSEFSQFEVYQKPEIDRIIHSVRQPFLDAIPDDSGACASISDFVFPSRLMRAVHLEYGDRWGVDTEDWVNRDVAEVLEEWQVRNRPRAYTLSHFLREPDHLWDEALLKKIRTVFTGLASRKAVTRNGVVEEAEAEEALALIGSILSTEGPLPGDGLRVLEVPEWSAKHLQRWWQANACEEPYVLEGKWWHCLYGDDELTPVGRRRRLKNHLGDPKSAAGMLLWYKLLGIACFISTGRRVSEIQKLWKSELTSLQFWKRTAEDGFEETVDVLFPKIVRRSLVGSTAHGENAYFWRRVFYDIRKIRSLVYEYSLPGTMLQLAVDLEKPDALLDFMRNGSVPGQKSWVGVPGQSASVPLFFVMRELRRLGVLTSDAADEHCFFVCRPVRRAAAAIGWLDPSQVDHYSFDQLKAISGELHDRLLDGGKEGKELLNLYDIPLLHYAQKELN